MSLQDLWVKWLERELYVSEFENPSSSFFSLEDSFVDQLTQTLSALDTPQVVKFGVEKTSPNGLVSITSAGIVTVNKTGPLSFKSRINLGRTGASGTSLLHLWVEGSTDGVTWTILGNAVQVRLDNSTETDTFFDFTPTYFPAGYKLRTMVARSSLGTNAGDVVQSPLSTGLLAYGLLPTPSAQLSVYKSNNWNYV